MRRATTTVLAVLAAGACLGSRAARADWVEYTPAGTPFRFLIQGGASDALAGRSVSLRHKYGTLYFDLEDVKRYQVPSTREQFMRLFRSAKAKDADACMEAAEWALKHAMLDEVYEAVEAALEKDPHNAEALRIQALHEEFQKALPESPQLESELRKFTRKRNMKILRSDHFILLHDTSDDKVEGERRTRAQIRLDLMETVFETFLLKFHSQGADLKVPDERMKVVLFADHKTYLNFVDSISPALTSAAGFWDPDSNTSVFYNQGTEDGFEGIDELAGIYEQKAALSRRLKLPSAGRDIRVSKSFNLVLRVLKEELDVTVVSHEATHQMAGNTGLFPRYVRVPAWVHEGLATYFEAPKGAAWAGIGAVSDERLEYYRALENDREHSNIDFIVGNQIFDYAGNNHTVLHGYAQAWALTHFLIERHFDKFMEYYKRLGDMPPDVFLSPELLTDVFNDVFGAERSKLDFEWREYMSQLKTDREKILGDD